MSAWESLCDWGVPSGAIRPASSQALDGEEVRDAVATLVNQEFAGLSQGDRESLLAWLRALRHHWPGWFEPALGPVGQDAITLLDDGEIDDNRYLKLRRIAIANLAARL
jgi:hypothetical protein